MVPRTGSSLLCPWLAPPWGTLDGSTEGCLMVTMGGEHRWETEMKSRKRSLDTNSLREWIRTREIADESYDRYVATTNQPTLHRWLVHKK